MTTRDRARPLPVEQRRTAILRAATPLVRAGGRSVTTREIAEAAGVAEGTVFHVFSDKESLIQAVVESEFETGRVLAELRAIDPGTSLHERLVRVVQVLGGRLAAVFELMTSLGMQRPPDRDDEPGGPGEAGEHGDHGRPAHGELLELIAVALLPDAARLRYSPEQTAGLIRLFAFAASHPSITGDAPLPAEEIVDVLLHGITTTPSEGPTC